MNKSEIKTYLENQLEEYLRQMNVFRNDKNPQIQALFHHARGCYDALEETYYKIFKKFYEHKQ